MKITHIRYKDGLVEDSNPHNKIDYNCIIEEDLSALDISWVVDPNDQFVSVDRELHYMLGLVVDPNDQFVSIDNDALECYYPDPPLITE